MRGLRRIRASSWSYRICYGYRGRFPNEGIETRATVATRVRSQFVTEDDSPMRGLRPQSARHSDVKVAVTEDDSPMRGLRLKVSFQGGVLSVCYRGRFPNEGIETIRPIRRVHGLARIV